MTIGDSDANSQKKKPLKEVKLCQSDQATCLSFSPSENWLIVMRDTQLGFATLNIYNIHQCKSSELNQPQILSLLGSDLSLSSSLSSIIWAPDERYFVSHVQGEP